MKIMSFNTCYGEQETQLREFLSPRLGKIAIFCFQESADDMENIIADMFDGADFDFATTKKRAPGCRYDLHTVVKKPLKISRDQTLFENDDPTLGQALATEIELEDGSILGIVNVHGVPFPGHKLDTEGRLKQTEQIVSWQNGSDVPAVICGDFNLLPEAESVKRFTKAGYQDLIAKYAIQTTRNRLAWELWPDNKQLFADFTFTSPEIVVTDFYVPDTEASDHLPMVIDIETPLSS